MADRRYEVLVLRRLRLLPLREKGLERLREIGGVRVLHVVDLDARELAQYGLVDQAINVLILKVGGGVDHGGSCGGHAQRYESRDMSGLKMPTMVLESRYSRGGREL